MLKIKLKGGALYVSVIISILISIILSLLIFIAYYNTRSVQESASLDQLGASLESGFEISQSEFYNKDNSIVWQKLPYNNDSVKIKKMTWGCYNFIDVVVKNSHFKLHKSGLFGVLSTRDTALYISEQNKPIGLAGKIKFNGFCYLPKSGIKSAYIDGTSFSDLNSLRPYIKNSFSTLPLIDENYLKQISELQNKVNPYTDSLLPILPDNISNSFLQKTATIQLGSVHLYEQNLKDNVKIIASDVIIVEKESHLDNVLLIARKIVFKKEFKGTVHAIAKDSIIVEDNCEFNYPSSFCVYNETRNNNFYNTKPNTITGIFFGESSQFSGALLAVNDKSNTCKMMIKLNKHFRLIGNLYSSDYCDVQGNLYGSVFCQSLLLQTASAVYENHLLNCLIDSRKFSNQLSVPNWFGSNKQKLLCAKIIS